MPHYEAVSDRDRIRTPSPLPAADSIQEVEDLKKNPRVYTQLSQDDESQQIDNSVRGHCIHAAFLVGLALLFASISITVGVLYHFSQSGGGLTTEQESRRYLWIYGPTAFIVLLRVFWRMIELKVKQSMPWHELGSGPASAEKTILLEYMSRTIFGNVWRSIKNRHWAVSMTIMGHLILLLMVVFATGLFTLESTLVTEQGVRFTYNRFDTSATNFSDLNPSPALLSYSIRAHNLSYPKGTTEDVLFPRFEPVEIFPEDTTFQSEVSGLKVNMECEHVHIKNSTIKKETLPWFVIMAQYFYANISTPACNITNVRLASGSRGRVYSQNTTQSYQPTMKIFACNTDFDDSHPHDRWLPTQDPANQAAFIRSFDRKLDTRILLSLADLGMNVPWHSENSAIWIRNLTVLLCKPSYTLNGYLVEYAQNSTTTRFRSLRNTGSSLPNLYPADFSRMIYNAFNAFADLFLGLGGADFTLSDPVPSFFQMIEAEMGGNKSGISLKDLMDPEILIPRAEALMKSSIIQMLHANILTDISDPTQDILEGTAMFPLDRLHIKIISTGFLSAGFAALAILCVALLFFIPHKFHAEKPIGSTFVVADALGSSPETLCASFLSGGKNPQSDLPSWSYTSHQNTGEKTVSINRVIPSHGPVSITADKTEPSDSRQEILIKQWWRPASSHTWFTAIVVALALIIIGILEGIQHVSDRNQGFVSVRSLDLGTTVLAQYIPAAIALAISLMFGSIEQMVSAVTPYASLVKGNVPASRTLSVDYMTKSGPHVLVLSLLNRHIALSIILLSTFVASFLSIIIPGLYSHITLPESMDTTVFLSDKFDPTVTPISFEDHGAAAMLNLLTYYDVEYPQWTFDDLAIPQFSAFGADLDSHKPTSQSSSTLSLRTTATRARLRCEPITEKMQWEPQTLYDGDIRTWTTARLPWSMCSNLPRGMSGNATGAGSVALESLRFDTNASTVRLNIGACGILRWTSDEVQIPYGRVGNPGDGRITFPESIDLPEWGCPSLLFTLGTLTFSTDETKTLPNSTIDRVWNVDPDVSTIVCWQSLGEVETNITLRYPDLTIPAENPPQPDESTVKWVQSRTAARDGTTFQFAPNILSLALDNPNGYLPEPLTQANNMDRVSQAMVHIALKEHNLTLSEFAGSAKDEMLPKIAQKLYGRYMAQVLSNNWRVDFDEATPQINITDTLWKPDTKSSASNLTSRLVARSMLPPATNHGHVGKRAESASRAVHAVITHPDEGARTRMVQNKKPKIALQAMLGFMAVGAILTKLLLRTKEVLPHEPYSIAGRAVLVANGNMLEKINGQRQVFGKDRLYRLGWWKDTAGVERYGICVQPQE